MDYVEIEKNGHTLLRICLCALSNDWKNYFDS
jgi:hypothetical protein